MDSSIPLVGGRFNTEQGQILTSADVDRIGDIGLSTFLNFLTLLFWDDAQGKAKSGFPRDVLGTDICKVTSTGVLSFSVSTGWGLVWSPSAALDPFAPSRYLPVVLDTPFAGSLAVHSSQPRIDIVCIAPFWVSDTPETRNVKDPSPPGATSPTVIDARRRFGATIQVVTGLPDAIPAAPNVPAGYVEIGRATVPATSGVAVWSDTRQVLDFGHHFKGLPRHAVDSYVPLGGLEELEVTATSPAAMAVNVERGRAVIGSISRMYAARRIALAASHATLHRYDVIVAQEDGLLVAVQGTPSATPVLPALTESQAPLGQVYVGATVTTITSGDIVNLRNRQPFDGTKRLQKGSTNWDRMKGDTVKVVLGTPTTGVDRCSIPISLVWPDGSDFDGLFDAADAPLNCVFEAQVFIRSPGVIGGSLYSDFDAFTADWGSNPGISDIEATNTVVWFVPAAGSPPDFNQNPVKNGTQRFWMPSRTGTLKFERENGTTSTDYCVVVRALTLGGGAMTGRINF